MISASLIIPTQNEATAIAAVLREVPRDIGEIIVADHNSTDATPDIARAHGAAVLAVPTRGYGAACQAGIENSSGELVAFMDADYSDYPADLASVIAPVANGSADLVIGARLPERRAMPAHQRLGNWFLCALIRIIYRTNCTDLGPMRCIRREVLHQLNMTDRDYGWTAEMQLKAMRMGFTVLEVPVRSRRRIGKSKISGTVTGTVKAAAKIFYWIIKLAVWRR